MRKGSAGDQRDDSHEINEFVDEALDGISEARERSRQEWVQWIGSEAIQRNAKQRIGQILDKAERLLAAGFPEACVVTTFIALEVLGREVVISSLATVLFPFFDQLADLFVESIFGRNGRLRNLKITLASVFDESPGRDSVWASLERGQALRNDIVHQGAETPPKEAGKILMAARTLISSILDRGETGLDRGETGLDRGETGLTPQQKEFSLKIRALKEDLIKKGLPPASGRSSRSTTTPRGSGASTPTRHDARGGPPASPAARCGDPPRRRPRRRV